MIGPSSRTPGKCLRDIWVARWLVFAVLADYLRRW